MKMLRLALVLGLALLWAPELHAQVFPGVVAPGGTIAYSSASVTCVNTTAECSVFQYTIPAAYLASATTVGALASQYYVGSTSSGITTPVLWNSPQPLHLSMLGLVSGGAATTYNVGVNLGGTAATVTLFNNLATAYVQQPIRLDVYITPIASVTATQSVSNNVFVTAVLTLHANSGSGGTATISAANVLASMNLASPTQLNVLNRWGAAASGSSIQWFKRVLKVGD